MNGRPADSPDTLVLVRARNHRKEFERRAPSKVPFLQIDLLSMTMTHTAATLGF